MQNDFLDYYHRELDYLRKMGNAFAQVHPELAAFLKLKGNDPHVERLLEGFAFLTARIRRKLDDEYPEITDALLTLLYPHYQRPVPSMAIAQFAAAADPTRIAAGLVIRRNTDVAARRYGKTCRFRTGYDTMLWPVEVTSARLERDRLAIEPRPAEATSLLRLGLRCTLPTDWVAVPLLRTLRFHLAGEEPVPSSLYHALFNDLCAIRLVGRKADGSAAACDLPLDSVRPVGFAENEGLLPYPNRSFPGYRLLQEFFAFPQKFLFFDLDNLDRIARHGFVKGVELLFFLKRPLKTEVQVRPDNFRLGCVPIVNLFETTTDPIPLDGLQTEYRVVPRHDAQREFEVFSVNRVAGSESWLANDADFHPFYSMRHATPGARRDAYWFTSRQPFPWGENGTEVMLSFADPDFNPRSAPGETLTAFITCTNRELPTWLANGVELDSPAAIGRVLLLTDPSPPLWPPLGRSAQWRMISALGLNYLSLVETGGGEPLRELLAIYDFADTDATRKMIGGIGRVKSEQVPGRTGNRLGNTVSLGVKVTVQFNEDAFVAVRAFLMACVLERFLGAYVSLNGFTQMVATSVQREGDWKRWAPRCGDRALL